jgi:hypothetical protein
MSLIRQGRSLGSPLSHLQPEEPSETPGARDSASLSLSVLICNVGWYKCPESEPMQCRHEYFVCSINIIPASQSEAIPLPQPGLVWFLTLTLSPTCTQMQPKKVLRQGSEQFILCALSLPRFFPLPRTPFSWLFPSASSSS